MKECKIYKKMKENIKLIKNNLKRAQLRKGTALALCSALPFVQFLQHVFEIYGNEDANHISIISPSFSDFLE